MTELMQIAKRSGPVKQYLRTFLIRYDQLFTPIRYNPVTILEIGIGGYKDPYKGGGSLRMWAEFFPNATVIGLDLHTKQLELPTNVRLEFGSQTDTELLNRLAAKYRGFDIVIDDASHVTEKTIITFETLWVHTRLLYIIEDLHMAKAIGTENYFRQVAGADFETLNMCVVTK